MTELLTVTVAKSTQEAIPELGRDAKNMYFVKIQNNNGESIVINIGENSYTKLAKLIKK